MTLPIERIVLVTAESAASAPAVARFIRRFADNLSLVVVSHPDESGHLLAETRAQWQRSGPRFVSFLAINFPIYRAWCRIHDLVARQPVGLERLCRTLGVATHVATDINSHSTRTAIASARPDVCVVYYFEQILHEEVIDIPTVGTVNVHTAMLPAHRGLFPEIWALAAKEPQIGVTIHEIVDRSIDAGPILAQGRIQVDDRWTVLAASRVAHLRGVELFEEAIDRLLSGSELPGSGRTESYNSFPPRRTLARFPPRGLARLSDLSRGPR